MKIKLNLFLFLLSLLVKSISSNELNTNLLYNIINENNDNYLKMILNNYFNLNIKEDGREEIVHIVSKFISENTSLLSIPENGFFECATELIYGETSRYKNYLNFLAFSGKGISDLGLEEECIKNGFIYYLLTYEYKNGRDVTFTDQHDTFLFFQQNIFYTGICLIEKCNITLNLLFNETLDPKFYTYLKDELKIENAKIYDVAKLNETKDPIPTYDNDGKYNATKTKNEQFKYDLYYILRLIVYIILFIQFFASIIIHLFYKPYIRSKEIKNELIERNNSVETEEENNENDNIFGVTNEKKEKEENCCKKGIGEFLYNYLSLFNNIKILLKKKNHYYNNSNLEIITFLRIFCMILITFINNFEVLIKIPSKDFFYESFYCRYSFFILKFTSFGVDMWICLDGFETMYKLISYYKKYVFLKNKSIMTFGEIFKFYLYSFYKLISFFIFFFLVNYFNKYFIFYHSNRALFEYYSNHIYNDKLENKKLFLFLIPGYSFYYIYNLKATIFEDNIISKFSLLFINEFYAFTIFLIIFYISNLLKSKIFDYIVFSVNIFLYLLNYWICQFQKNDRIYYSYKLVLDNFLTIRYPHIIFNYFFLGAMAGLTCFYFKDSFESSSMSNDNEKSPFRFCYSAIKLFDYLVQNGRFFWIFLLLILQLIISFSFTLIIKINNNKIFIPFNGLQKFVLCYETGAFILFFSFMIVLMFFIRNENENKTKNYSSLLMLIDRTSFSFLNTINLVMYAFYCVFYFQLKLNYQNLWIITFGMFFFVCLENLVLTLAFVFLLKMINKKLMNFYLKSNKEKMKENEILNKQSELLDKSRETTEYKY